jgi:hypothetical protein
LCDICRRKELEKAYKALRLNDGFEGGYGNGFGNESFAHYTNISPKLLGASTSSIKRKTHSTHKAIKV